jgi:hypothetical protein
MFWEACPHKKSKPAQDDRISLSESTQMNRDDRAKHPENRGADQDYKGSFSAAKPLHSLTSHQGLTHSISPLQQKRAQHGASLVLAWGVRLFGRNKHTLSMQKVVSQKKGTPIKCPLAISRKSYLIAAIQALRGLDLPVLR